MSRRREEDVELVLSNKQLLSFLFVVVVFFAAFFSVGYKIGYEQGETANATARLEPPVEEPVEKAETVRLPDALLKDAPKPLPAEPTPVESAPASPAPAEQKPSPATAAATAVSAPSPAPVKAVEPPKAAPKPAPKPVAKAEPKQAAPKAAAARTGEYHLQVAALRLRADAESMAGKLTAKGYPASVFTGGGDEWIRVVVGPFASAEAAKTFQDKLKKDGFATMLRRF